MEEKEKDYSKLEGKEIKILNAASGCGRGIIIGCDPDIGITIVDAEDKDLYIHCLIGPAAPNFCDSPAARERYIYRFAFYAAILEGEEYDLELEPMEDTATFLHQRLFGMCKEGKPSAVMKDVVDKKVLEWMSNGRMGP